MWNVANFWNSQVPWWHCHVLLLGDLKSMSQSKGRIRTRISLLLIGWGQIRISSLAAGSHHRSDLGSSSWTIFHFGRGSLQPFHQGFYYSWKLIWDVSSPLESCALIAAISGPHGVHGPSPTNTDVTFRMAWLLSLWLDASLQIN